MMRFPINYGICPCSIKAYRREYRNIFKEFGITSSSDNIDFSDGLVSLKGGSDLTIIATGIMVHRAFEVMNRLSQHSIDAGIIDLYRIKPVNKELLLELVSQSKMIVTLEEHSIVGGIGSIVSEILSDAGESTPLKRIALSDTHCYEYGGREWLHSIYELDVDSIVKKILDCS